MFGINWLVAHGSTEPSRRGASFLSIREALSDNACFSRLPAENAELAVSVLHGRLGLGHNSRETSKGEVTLAGCLDAGLEKNGPDQLPYSHVELPTFAVAHSDARKTMRMSTIRQRRHCRGD